MERNSNQFSLDRDDGALEATAIAYLKEKGLTVAFAESCTGGLTSKRIVDVPGASAVFVGSVVSYSNDVKMRLLGVKRETLAAHGAVSMQTAREMAQGVCEATGADIGISVTGIAGPASDDTKKPVGLVYIGRCQGGEVKVVELDLSGNDRQSIRYLSSSHAIYSIFSY